MTDTKVEYMKQELIYTSHLHTETVLDHCMLTVDLALLSNIHTELHHINFCVLKGITLRYKTQQQTRL